MLPPRALRERQRIGLTAGLNRFSKDGIRAGCGAGHGIDVNLGQAHESALKEAETDAMKRALMTFGNPFGLALYDKRQREVTSSATEAGEQGHRGLGPAGHQSVVRSIQGLRPPSPSAQGLGSQQGQQSRSIAILVLTTTSWPRIRQVTGEIRAAIATIEGGVYMELPIP